MQIEPTQRTRTSIVVVDDDASVRQGLVRLLGSHGLAVSAFASPELLLADIEALSPDCVVADLAMPGLNGFDLQQMLSALEPDYPIIFVSGVGDIPASVQAMRGGAVDFLAKPVNKNALFDAIDRAVARSRNGRQVREWQANACRNVNSLTKREREVFDLVVMGCLNKQIAATLTISERTVKVHRSRVMQKMSVRSVAQLARIAERLGIRSAPL